MLIIKGSAKSGKSRKGVKEYLENLNVGVDTLIIDNEGVPYHEFIEKKKLAVDVYFEYVDNKINIEDLKKVIGKFERVVFDLGVKENRIVEFNNLSKELGIEAVLTVQSHASDSTNIIELYRI